MDGFSSQKRKVDAGQFNFSSSGFLSTSKLKLQDIYLQKAGAYLCNSYKFQILSLKSSPSFCSNISSTCNNIHHAAHLASVLHTDFTTSTSRVRLWQPIYREHN